MLRRRRVRFLLAALIRWMLAPNLEWWSQVGQAELDENIEATYGYRERTI